MKLKTNLARVMATVTAVTMSLAFFPKIIGNDTVLADTVKKQKNTCLGTSKIASPVAPDNKDSAWSGSYVYYGTYDGNPIKFRVLAPNTNVYGGTTMFLDSDEVLFKQSFDDTDNVWSTSDIREHLNGVFLNDSFSVSESAAIATSRGTGGIVYASGSYEEHFYKSPVSINDKILLLDAGEILNPEYGYSADTGWSTWYAGGGGTYHSVLNHVKKGPYATTFFWLRSPNSVWGSKYIDCISSNSNGELGDIGIVFSSHDVAPALNVDLSKVLFSTAIDGNLSEIGTSFKLTILDNNLSVNTDSISVNGTTISGTATGNADQVSVLITDGEWNAKGSTIKYYGVYSGSFDYSSYVSSNMHVYLISEDINGAKETDYASTPVDIINRCTVTFNSNGGSGSMSNLTIPENSKITLPECSFNPPSADKTFKYWIVSSITGYSEPGDEVAILCDTQVTAVWATAFIVSFDMNGHGNAPATQTVARGNRATVPSDPSASGYTFGGWYKDSACTVAYDFNSKVTDNVTLFAKWTEVPATSTTGGGFEDFVERLYTVALDRPSEPEGKAFWCEKVKDGTYDGAYCARFFLTSPEFLGKNKTDGEFVDTLYKTFFDRKADDEGRAFWVNKIKESSKETVIEGFINSEEWCNICASYGVKSGAQWAKATVASKNATAFASRLYTECLGREPEEGGLKYWSLSLTNLERTGTQAAKEFFYSPEFKDKDLNDDEYVERLYKTFMGRPSDTEGKSHWLNQLSNGSMTRDQVFDFFSTCEEFTGICKDYAIDR